MDDHLRLELHRAKEEHRQPLCPHCHEPLVIEEMHYTILDWRWNQEREIYEKEVQDNGSHRPCCVRCETEFRLFIGETKLLTDLGLEY